MKSCVCLVEIGVRNLKSKLKPKKHKIFYHDIGCRKISFKTKVKEISSLLKSWQHRKLTLMGKITLIKTLALPKIIHLLTALPNLPESKLNNSNSIFYNFIWNSKPDKIKRNTMIGHFMKGGGGIK